MGRKNRADILMALDCMEVAATYPQIDSFAILSLDSDFSPLIYRLRALGKRVAWVTVGEIPPNSRPLRALESMATHRVTYDQSVIDDAGSSVLEAALAQLDTESAGALETGVALRTLEARLRAIQPHFTHEALGFRSFDDFVDACVEAPFVLRDNMVVRHQPPAKKTEPPAKAAAPAAPAPAFSSQPSAAVPPPPPPPTEPLRPTADREREFNSVLSRLSLRPLPGLRKEISRWLLESVFQSDGRPPQATATAGALQDLVEGEFYPRGFSKSQIREVLKLYYHAGVIGLDRSGGAQFRECRIGEMKRPEDSRKELVASIVDRLQNGGVTIVPTDIPALAWVIFESDEEIYLKAVAEGIAMANSRPKPPQG